MPLDAGETHKTFQWDDPLDLTSASPRRSGWSARRPAPTPARSCCRGWSAPSPQERFDREIMTEMGALGFLGPTLPEDYGCAGVNHVAYGLIAREIEAIDSGYRSAMSVQSSLVMYPIYAFGSEEQRRRWLPGMARGEIVGCFGLTEADGGSDPASMRTVAQGRRRAASCSTAPRCGSPTRRSPTWPWSGPSSTASSAASWSSAAPKGFETPKIENKLSLRASVTGEIALSDVFVPEDAMLPDVQRPARAVLLPQQGALRHRLGRDGRGGVLLPRRARLRRLAAACSASRWPRASWCRRSWPTCRPRSRSATRARWRWAG